jgi:hypothetical protein
VRTIAEQAAERNVPVPVGATAGELRRGGWQVPTFVMDSAVLDAIVPGEPLNVHVDIPQPTGYCWRRWRPATAQGPN